MGLTCVGGVTFSYSIVCIIPFFSVKNVYNTEFIQMCGRKGIDTVQCGECVVKY